MSVLRRFALPFYRWATQAKRDVFARQFTAAQKWPAAILFYHRVADHTNNTWTIHPKRFTEHLDLVDSIGSFASLDEIREDQRKKVRTTLKVAITFDDGYAENMEWAIPELIRRNIPCTYFVSTDFALRNIPFPHDAERGHPLRANSIAQILEMAKAGIQIGGHTRSHLDLGRDWSQERLRSELCDSRKQLQDWTGQSIDYFAFPYGMLENISQSAIDIVVEAGYRAFVSAYGAWNFPTGDDFHLTRFHGDPCTEALHNWLTLDPRRIEPRYVLDYQRTDRSVPSEARVDTSLPISSKPTVPFPTFDFGALPLYLPNQSR
jgi:peptidoglycan/xylan/chitin deacetylase (PgdA/CDA1 family)